jgi:hypothetical protein
LDAGVNDLTGAFGLATMRLSRPVIEGPVSSGSDTDLDLARRDPI